MSWGLKASILIALQSRRGEWCHAAWIADRVVARAEVVGELCGEMADAGELQMAEMPGTGDLVFGVDVIVADARINDAAEPAQPSEQQFSLGGAFNEGDQA